MLQYLKSPDYDAFFEEALANTTSKIRTANSSEVLKVVLLGNYLSAFIYNSEATFKYLEQEGILEPVFEELFTCDCKMFHKYQRKLYLYGLGECLFSNYIPEYINHNISTIISKLILMLGRLNLTEKYKIIKQGDKQKQEEESRPAKKNSPPTTKPDIYEDELSDYEEEKIEQELKDINDYYDKQSTLGIDTLDKSNPPFTITKGDHSDKDIEETKDKEHDDELNDSL